MRTAVITGGAGEIGKALATSFAEDGYSVHIIDVTDRAHAIATELGGTAHVGDVNAPEVQSGLQELTEVHALVNGVGMWPLIPVDDLPPERWRELVDVNLGTAYAAIWSCRGGLRSASGAVVNIASAIALKGHPQMAYYAAAKAGVLGMTKSLAQALGPDGVRVNSVAPGLVTTARNASRWSPEQQEAFRRTRALPVDLEVADVVAAVRFFASPAARVITGQTLVVDGGTVLH